MSTVRELACVLGLAASAFAQDPAALFEKAPPDIDEALRARVQQFYQLHVERKFRAAEELVAEDSKDIFYEMEKQSCRTFDIMKITYSENFSRAVVIIACDTEVLMAMGGGLIPVKMPLRSEWRSIDRQWFWRADPPGDREVQTPFGTHKPPASNQAGGFLGAPAGAPVNLESLTGMVSADKSELRFDAVAPASDQVVVTSKMPGEVNLSVEPAEVPGLEFKFDRTKLTQNESATLSIRYQPSAERRAPPAIKLKIVVLPLDQELPVTVIIRQPPPRVPAN